MQTIQVASSSRAAVAIRPTRQVSALRVRVVAPRVVVARTQEGSTDDASAQVTEAANKAVTFVKTTWEKTPDSEKPAAIAIIVGVVLAQIAIGATMDSVDKLPLIKQFLELVGLTVTGVYGYKYFTDPEERINVKSNIDSFIDAITGK